MNQNIRRLISIFVLGMFVLGACQSQSQKILPITGSNNEAALPAQVDSARQNVLEYVLASRLTDIPSQAEWQFQEIQNENEYHFRSGDWLMVIWTVEDGQHQPVVIVNRVDSISWTGYMTPEGRVVDTAYGR